MTNSTFSVFLEFDSYVCVVSVKDIFACAIIAELVW